MQKTISVPDFRSTQSVDQRGFNRIWESKRSKCYLFELDSRKLDKDHPRTLLKIHTNDSSWPINTYSASASSKTLNRKYQISRLLTHFFRHQKVLPKRIQHKY